jgi:hypothetical protein
VSFRIGTPFSRGAGYFLNNKGLGHAQHEEDDVQSCPHCQGLIKMREWKASSVQNFCMKCMKPTCDSPNCQNCVPFGRTLDEVVKSRFK